MAYVSLKQGDNLTTQLLAGGSARTSSLEETNSNGNGTGVWHQLTGGNAYLIKLNGSPLIGAGGKGGWSARAMTYTYAGRYDFSAGGTVPSGVNNAKFSSGAGGSFATWGERQGFQWTNGGNGNTIAGCTPAQTYPNELRGADAGCNYLDTSKCTLVGTPNNGTGVSVTLRPVIITEKQSLSGIDDGVSRIANNLGTIATRIGELKSAQQTLNNTLQSTVSTRSSSSVVTNVTAGESFTVYASMEVSQTGTFTDGGVTCVNNDAGDGYIKLSGRITTKGSKEYLFGGTKVVINAVDVPNGSNVNVTLD